MALSRFKSRRSGLFGLVTVVLLLCGIYVWSLSLAQLATLALSCAVCHITLILLSPYHSESTALRTQYDYVIVGAGSAGCALASRLSEDARVSVCLLESGGPDSNLAINVPAACAELQHTDVDWELVTEPQTHACQAMEERRSRWPCGRVVGGSSSINYMAYVRGNKADYDRWAHEEGCDGWAYEDVLPLFVRMETNTSTRSSIRESGLHGTEGPLFVSDQVNPQPVSKAWVEAVAQAGVPKTRDYNGEEQLGVGLCQVTQRKGERWSSARAYLDPVVASRPNLDVVSYAHVVRVLFDADKTASGVAVLVGKNKDTKRNKAKVVHAREEVIVSAGAVHSAKLLMLSGIGPKEHLEEHGIEVVADLPVGRKLLDHLMAPLPFEVNTKTLSMRDKNLSNVLKYLLCKRGPVTSNGLEGTAFVQTGVRPDLGGSPDLQLHMAATLGTPRDFANFGILDKFQDESIYERNGFTMLPVVLHPQSVGTVTLRSKDPFEPAVIDPHYLEHPNDVRTLIEGMRLGMKAAEQPALRALNATPVLDTWKRECPHEVGSDEFWEWVIRHGALTVYHPVATCRMGAPDNPASVVSPTLEVLGGVKRLRVADASIMPTLVSGNTNAAAIMVGEKASDLIRASYQARHGRKDASKRSTSRRRNRRKD